MSDFPEVLFRLHEGLPKQGPGSDESTKRALALVPDLPAQPEILDLACGPGRQTLVLARLTGGHVTAVDREPRFLAQLLARGRAAGLEDRITTVRGLLERLELPHHAFDLVWCEGAAYILGFEHALHAWREYLRPGGCLALSELCWLDQPRPQEVSAFFAEGYPDMRTVTERRDQIAATGYELLGDFVLPDSDWWTNYYEELEKRLPGLEEELADDEEARALLAESRREIELFREKRGSYGYVFFVAQRSDRPA